MMPDPRPQPPNLPPHTDETFPQRQERSISPRLAKLRQLRHQQKQRVRLLIGLLAFALLFGVMALPVRFLSSDDRVEHRRDRLSDYLTSEPERIRHRDNPFIDTYLNEIAPEVRALLDTIAFAEGTHDDLGYQTLFTFSTFNGYGDHPRRLRCASHRGRRLCSDAAGRYQMISSTFDTVANRLNLDDFSPKSQDLAAVELIRLRGGLRKIEAGDFDGAIRAIRREWASLPGAGYGQPQASREELKRIYEQRLEHYQGLDPVHQGVPAAQERYRP
ncbi:MAG: glycoside hydrolase family 104 protein [Phormidium sp. BM_Day4_Bin.17]|nr:glycoside hydrolase family 104 protein [Phormidium sp. BM_Day4_Bin.17]UCJ10769.1 MAG: glycoside hydrolase family 104 protein [Phormidium sp. PBR-2020]